MRRVQGFYTLCLLLWVGMVACSESDSGSDSSDTTTTTTTTISFTDQENPPDSLVLAFNVDDLRLLDGLISPFGIVRHSKDLAKFGHGGIDIPVNDGVPIYAVEDGLIFQATDATDNRPGTNMILLLGQTSGDTGWAFLYEHIDLVASLSKGSLVTKGDQIATGHGSAAGGLHMQLTFLTPEGFYQNHTCWAEQLTSDVKSTFISQFENDIRNRSEFIAAWQTASESDGTFPYAGLLDTTTYPNGAQLCYTQGTDVR